MRAAIIPAERTVQIIMENPPDTLLRIGIVKRGGLLETYVAF